MFTKGQKVVCIDDSFHFSTRACYTALPVKGVTYTVRNVVLGISIKGERGEICVYLNELSNPKSNTWPFPERGFNAERFASLDDVTKQETAELLNAA